MVHSFSRLRGGTVCVFWLFGIPPSFSRLRSSTGEVADFAYFPSFSHLRGGTDFLKLWQADCVSFSYLHGSRVGFCLSGARHYSFSHLNGSTMHRISDYRIAGSFSYLHGSTAPGSLQENQVISLSHLRGSTDYVG